MTAYCDTSLIVRRLLPGPHRDRAIEISNQIELAIGFVPITRLTRFEVLQSLRFELWLNSHDRTKGQPAALIEPALNLFLAEIGSTFHMAPLDADPVLAEAERLSQSTPKKGWRTVDVLHVASALTLNATDFFSFDKSQNDLAAQQGLMTLSLQL